MAETKTTVATVDARSYFEQTLEYGLKQGILDSKHLARMREEGAKALVQIANHFGSAYLRANLETALIRFSNLASLFLEDKFGGDLQGAARSLRDNTLLSHSRGGSEMLKYLHAMPDSTLLLNEVHTPASQRQFLDEYSFAMPMTAATFRAHRLARVDNQLRIAFARLLGKKLGASESAYSLATAEEVIRSALLVCYVGMDPLRLPRRSDMAKAIASLRKKSFKPKLEVWERLLRDAPSDYQQIGEWFVQDFTEHQLPRLKGKRWSAEDVISGEGQGTFFVDMSIDDDVAEYERITTTEWFKVTRGRTDPDFLATVFLSMAAGMPPKRSLLLREAKELIAAVRETGFDSVSVIKFIETFAPPDKQEGLLHMWKDDLLPDAEMQLLDPLRDDTNMVRALRYLKEYGIANWKSDGHR